MNLHLRHEIDRPTPRTFTVADLRRMLDAGIIDEDENLELIDGELIPMASKGRDHDLTKSSLNRLLSQAAGDDLLVCVENTLKLAENVLVEPDIAVFQRSAMLDDPQFIAVDGKDVLLIIEVAVTSLAYDRGVKASLYARHRIQEYWVIEPPQRRVWVHARPSDDGWGSLREAEPAQILTPSAPALGNFHVS